MGAHRSRRGPLLRKFTPGIDVLRCLTHSQNKGSTAINAIAQIDALQLLNQTPKMCRLAQNHHPPVAHPPKHSGRAKTNAQPTAHRPVPRPSTPQRRLQALLEPRLPFARASACAWQRAARI